MRLGPLEQTLPNKRLTEQQLDILLRPVLRRQGLQEHHDFLEVHALQLFAPFDEEGGADVEVEVAEALVFGLRDKGRLVGMGMAVGALLALLGLGGYGWTY